MEIRGRHILGWVATVGAFALYLALTPNLGARLGLAWVPLGLAPTLLAALFFGVWGGMIFAFAMYLAGTAVAAHLGFVSWSFYFDVINLVRAGVGVTVGGLVGHMRDLYQRLRRRSRELEEESARLRSAEEHLAQAHALANLGSWEADARGNTVRVSAGLARILGIAQGSPLSFTQAAERILPEDRQRFREGFRRFQAAGGEHEAEIRIRRPDGSLRHLRIRARIQEGKEGRSPSLHGIAQDVTDLRLAEERNRLAEKQRQDIEHLAELNQFKSRFVSAAAHELNTPMTPIILQLEVLRSPKVGPLTPEQRRSLDVLERNIRRLSALLRDLLDASRLQSQGLRFTMESVDPGELVQEAVESFRPMAQRDGLHLEVRAAPIGPIWTDPRRFSQVLYNLLSNALKFTPGGKRIEVSLQNSGPRLRLIVRDEGIGMRDDQLGRLFQPFAQVSDPGARQQGTGLGLYVSKGIVEQLGGSIHARSDGPGRGSVFTVELPLVRITPSNLVPTTIGPVLAP